MSIVAQDINEALAKGTYTKSINNTINVADNYLLSLSDKKPTWLDRFLTLNKNKLTETIYRANRKEGLASLSGYSEGYFNEIIQNANDLHCGNIIDFYCSKDDDQYSVKCLYKDKGFTTSNIYGFLNREMSDKDEKRGQTGKYGIGIKSFFQFVDYFEINSNIIIRFKINRSDIDNLKIISYVGINEKWDKKHTTLSFSYSNNIETSFNLSKLNDLIEYLANDKSIDVNKTLFTGETHDLLFDIRSLMFMNNHSKSISKLNFHGNSNSIKVNLSFGKLEKYKLSSQNYELRTCNITINNESYPYLISTINKINYAFSLFDEETPITRYYSTYFIKNSADYTFPVCINSNYSNMHRSDIGDTLDSIANAKKHLKNSLCNVFSFFTSTKILNSKYLIEASTIFHNAAYNEISNNINFNESVLCKTDSNTNLPLTTDRKNYLYIVKRKDNEKYEESAYTEGNIKEELISCFNDVFAESKILFLNELENNYLCEVIYLTYTELDKKQQTSDMNIEKYNMLLNYFSDVQSFVSFRISNQRERIEAYDSEIDAFLSHYNKNYHEYILKIIGRYKLNAAVEYDGSINSKKLSFLEYLFNSHIGKGKGLLERKQNEIYNTKFLSLKKSLMKNRYYDTHSKKGKYNIPFIKPTWLSTNNWDGKFDYNPFYLQCDNSPIANKDKFLFVKQIIKDYQLQKNILLSYTRTMLFQKEKRDFWCRDNRFVNWEYCYQQVINIDDCFNIHFDNFEPFLDMLTETSILKSYFKEAELNFRCSLVNITTEELINDIFPSIFMSKDYFIDYPAYYNLNITKVEIDSRSELENSEKYTFIQKMTNLKINIFKYNSNSRNNSVFYMHNGQVKANLKNKNTFMSISKCDIKNDSLIIFYDNFKGDIDKILQFVLSDIGIGETTLEFVNSFVGTVDSVIALDYKSYESINAFTPSKVNYDWQPNNNLIFKINYDYNLIKRILTSRGNYGDICPFCGEGLNEEKKVIVLLNQNRKTKNKYPYIVTICCKNCFERLKDTLASSKLIKDRVVLEKKSYHGQNEILIQTNEIQLSPINMEIIKLFNNQIND